MRFQGFKVVKKINPDNDLLTTLVLIRCLGRRFECVWISELSGVFWGDSAWINPRPVRACFGVDWTFWLAGG